MFYKTFCVVYIYAHFGTLYIMKRELLRPKTFYLGRIKQTLNTYFTHNASATAGLQVQKLTPV
jgi:hypothetical protein